MTVLISGETKRVLLKTQEFKKILQIVLKRLSDTDEHESFKAALGRPKSLELHFCDDVEMRAYQKRFRKLDRTTDVLSFPALESPKNSPRHFLGTIVISMPSVERNAKRYKRKVRAELEEVYIHGILHLLGFDHVGVSVSKKKRMRAFQKELLGLVQK